MRSPANVTVLLCTWNGERHLRAQLDSIVGQSLAVSRVIASDDHSTDNTWAILGDYVSIDPAFFSRCQGPGEGFVANFLSLLCREELEGDYFALSDQDDIWDDNKLLRAVRVLQDYPAERPVLYCARTRAISDKGSPMGLSPLFTRPPGFANALVQNIGGGNTMVMNGAARDLLRQAGQVDVASHDWWCYLLISGSGGTVIYDPQPCLSYRQHPANQIGANLGWGDRLKRYTRALSGRNREWSERNIQALLQNQDLLSADARRIFERFSVARNAGVVGRLSGIRQAGLYAQTRSGSLGLFIAALLKKI